MENHLLEYIEIKDFKCFKNFEAKGFKRVNLIGGKNNVGKTAFMEACYVNISARKLENYINALSNIARNRDKLNFLHDNLFERTILPNESQIKYMEISSGISTKSNIDTTLFQIENGNGIINYIFKFSKENIRVSRKDFDSRRCRIPNIKFLDNFGLTNLNILKSYSSIQIQGKEDFLNKKLHEFDSDIISFKIILNKAKCNIGNDEYRDIVEFGDGTKHLISIIISFFACKDGYLFIDEIDNGIHYTQLDRLWEIILTISKEQNVQVFATTHSKECIDAYARVSKKLEDENISFISLYKNRENKLKSISLNYEDIQDRIELGLDNR